MKRLLIIALIAAATPAFASLKTGTRVTDFTTTAVLAGKPYSYNLNKALKKGPVVLYFFPKAFTSGCTVEAHEFAEASGDFAKAGASIMGMSADDLPTLKKFSVEACRNKFPVAVGSQKVIAAFDAALSNKAGMSNRTTYVIAPDGKVIYTFSDLNVRGHVMGSLKAVQDWRAAQRPKK